MADPITQVPVKVHGHMAAVLSDSDSSSDESSQDEIEVEFREKLADSPCYSVANADHVQFPAVEMNGIMMSGLPPTPNRSSSPSVLGTEASMDGANGTKTNDQPVDNAFGIAYKPCGGSSRQGYELPAGPAFVDEDEFEQELGTEFRVVVGSPAGSSEKPMISGTAQSENVSKEIGVVIDDFFDDDGNDCRAKEQQKASGRGRRFALTYSQGHE